MTLGDNIVNQIAENEWLGKADQAGENDKKSSKSALSAVPGEKRPQILQASLQAGIATLADNAVPGQLPGTSLL